MKTEKSAGAVLYRKKGKKVYFLLLQYEAGHYDFTKGHIEKGETEQEAAVREIKEETGINDVKFTDGFRKIINYFYKIEKEKVSKTVIFLLGETKKEHVILSFEHRGYGWFTYEEALKNITFSNSRNVLKAAYKFLKENKTLKDFG